MLGRSRERISGVIQLHSVLSTTMVARKRRYKKPRSKCSLTFTMDIVPNSVFPILPLECAQRQMRKGGGGLATLPLKEDFAAHSALRGLSRPGGSSSCAFSVSPASPKQQTVLI